MDDGSLESAKSTTWRPTQAYLMAAVCLLIGLPVGYFLHPPAASSVPATSATQPASAQAGIGARQQMPTLEQMKQVADRQAQPVLEKLKSNPNDPETLHELGRIYRATHQFKEAAGYYAKALQSDPKNIMMRADYATCLYYTGDVDGALAELNTSLSYDPKHAGTLFNIGVIEWQGKHDAKKAIASWQKLLKENPNYEGKQQVEHLIVELTKSTTQPSSAPKS